MTEKDYSLLRPFDLEAAKGGVKMCDRFNLKKTHTYVAGPDSGGWIVTKNENGIFIFSTETNLFMLPICWVEGKPVYPDTPMEREDNGWPVAWSVDGNAWQDDGGNWSDEGGGFKIRWPRPKPVKRWINVYPNTGYDTKAAADQEEVFGRIACIEIELPSLPAK